MVVEACLPTAAKSGMLHQGKEYGGCLGSQTDNLFLLTVRTCNQSAVYVG